MTSRFSFQWLLMAGAFQPTGDILNKNIEINGNILAMCYLYRFYIHN